MDKLDRRLNAYRNEIAAISLKGQVESARFCEPIRRRVLAGCVPMRKAPDAVLGYETELLAGELVDVYEIAGGFAWGQAVRDGYVGYLPADALGDVDPAPTHRVVVLRTFLYPGASIKATPLGFLPYGAEVAVITSEGDFCRTSQGHVYAPHLAALPVQAADPIFEAERFLGVPYLWGGKSSLGVDCSGLVQIVCFACGITCLRNSDMQEKGLGTPLVMPNTMELLARGALLFWPGHVAISQGNGRMIHASGYHMTVESEEIAPALLRLESQGHALRSARLLPGFG
ncbi:Bacterial dipeptidyl-peptidase SH3 domain containing protein [Rhabdaerophilaceae bacterium]